MKALFFVVLTITAVVMLLLPAIASFWAEDALQRSGDVVRLEPKPDLPIEMAYIEPGTFQMGSPESEARRDADETLHEVTITKAFWLGRTEVTQAQWEAVMGSNPSEFAGNPNHPVERVSWYDAVAFCNRLTEAMNAANPDLGLRACYQISEEEKSSDGRIRSAKVEWIPDSNGFRLPTEAEWEFACRAGTTTAYSFGNDASRLGEYAWYGDNSGDSTSPVATRKPNAWGLHDMHGNVLEWCADWYGEYPSGAATDPQGPKSGAGRVSRGGSWFNFSEYCRAADRINTDPVKRLHTFGFRVARTP